jgi:glycosyltransferase involved in cell wall biosynthesis
MNKRILIFSLAYYPHVSGAEIAIKEITNRILDNDIAFDVITLRFDSSSLRVEKVGNVCVYRVVGIPYAGYINKALFPALAAIGAYRLHRKNKYDAFWAMMSYMVLPIVLLRMFGTHVPYILTLQDGDPFEHVFNRPRIFAFKPLLISGFKNAAVVQVISNYLGGWAQRLGYGGSVVVIPNGADTKKFMDTSLPTQTKEYISLITTSRLVHKNAVDDVLRALVLLPNNIQFQILGSGVEEASLKALAQSLGVATRVQFLGNVDNAEVSKYLHASDIFIRPSRSEGMGISFIEAMAAGVPVIATQEGGIADFLFDAKRNPQKPTTGWAVDKNSPEQIANAVKDIIHMHSESDTESVERVARVVENARKLVQEKYDWDRIAKDMREKVFAPVLKTS